ncbi:alpha/beta hydrolase [Roseomonas sp. M0104]|uniref:Alpha/beta hydrolase n=1 Tax=Teichococcus coralli TaxID=2545983 RepID=A0A845BEC5_9PROT|nr:alpha/beta hydrolase [Pseudoroseomonas coralli]MXP64460.1 alpha/beta hydrolase [Pseudoroseomonas coralli]
MPAPFRTRDGTALFHRDWPPQGPPQGASGPPVVFAASWSLPSDSWCYQMLALAEAGFRCVAYDRRGHGRSDDPGRGYDFDTLADDLAALLDHLDLRGATLVGFSMGCGEVLRYLTRHGAAGRVARAVLVGTTTPKLARAPDNPAGLDPALLESFRRDWLMRDFPGWIDANMEPFVSPETPAGLRHWVRDMALRSSLQALLECHRTLAAADFRAEARAIGVPVLLLHGERDITSPLDLTARPTAALLPDARLEIYEDAPHGLFLTHQARLNADLIAFARG